MCWQCHEQNQSSYRACDGCANLKELNDLQKYDIHKEWGQLVEFIEQKKRFLILCASCVAALNAYRESTRRNVAETEPSVWHNYGSRDRDKNCPAIPVGVHCVGDQKTLGIRCARSIYGYNAVEEILQGFVYHDDGGHRIRRLTLGDTDETMRCDKCWLALWECNAGRVRR